MPISSIPTTAWHLVAAQLQESPEDLLSLSSMSFTLKKICRPLLSAHFESVATDSATLYESYPWHSMLMLILNGHVDPLFILEFHYFHGRRAGVFESTAISRPALKESTVDAVFTYDRLYREAASQFIPTDVLDVACNEFAAGSEDAALAVLLPLCQRIKSIDIPQNDMPFLEAVFMDISDQYRTLGINGQEARRRARQAVDQDLLNANDPVRRRYARSDDSSKQQLPFSELLFVRSDDYQECHNASLQHFLPFLGLPSLHRITLYAIRRVPQDYPFQVPLQWPARIKCSCPEIYFARSSVDRSTILAFLEGINDPCDIKQWFLTGRDEPRPHIGDPDWDHAVLTIRDQGSRDIRITEDYGLGQFGYEQGWVCWIHCGLMSSWKHIHDDMKPMTYEDADPWIGGPL